MHVKRQSIPKSWPIPRKGTKYIVVASHDKKNGIPLLILLRDVLEVARNKKEVKKILNSRIVSVNGKTVKKENFSALPFDVIKIGEKNYELTFSDKRKFMLKETERKERILKVINKKILKNKKTQLNLIFGKNIVSEEKVGVGDSVVLIDGKISKILPLSEGREAVVFSGKYSGRQGKLEKIENRIATLSHKNEKINVPIKNIMVVK